MSKVITPQTPQIYYVPTDSVCRTVKKMKTNSPNLKFFKLPSSSTSRKQYLQDLNGVKKAIFIWGNGYQHGESYHFDYNGANVKLNVDGHDDMGFYSGDQSLYYSHMFASYQNLGIKTCYSLMKDNGSDDFELLFVKKYHVKNVSVKYIAYPTCTNINLNKKLNKRKVHLTVDLDSVIGFPAVTKWTNNMFLSLDRLLGIISDIATNSTIVRIDFGGLKDSVTDQEFEVAYEIQSELLNFAIKNINS